MGSPEASKAEKQKFVETKYRPRELPVGMKQPQVTVRPVPCKNEDHALQNAVLSPPVATVASQLAPTNSGVGRVTSIPDSIFDELFGDMDILPINSCKHASPFAPADSISQPPLDLLA